MEAVRKMFALTYRPDRSLWELIFRIANTKKHTWFPKPRISYRPTQTVCATEPRDTMRSCIFARRIWIETVNVGLPLLLKIKQTNGTNGINEIVNAQCTTHTQAHSHTALHSMHTEIVYNKNKLHKIKFKRTVPASERRREHGNGSGGSINSHKPALNAERRKGTKSEKRIDKKTRTTISRIDVVYSDYIRCRLWIQNAWAAAGQREWATNEANGIWCERRNNSEIH